MKKPKVSDSLRKFLIENCGAEDLDKLAPRPPEGTRIADLCFKERSVILELKEILNVSAGKDMRTYKELHEAHLKHGVNTKTGHPNFKDWSQEEMRRYNRFFLDDTTFLQKKFSEASEQIEHTKGFLNVQDARGVLLILNTSPNVSPIDLYYRSINLMSRYRQVESVLCYSVDLINKTSMATILDAPRYEEEPSFLTHLLDCIEKNRINRTGFTEGPPPLEAWKRQPNRLLPRFP